MGVCFLPDIFKIYVLYNKNLLKKNKRILSEE
jgi:hypothetical protein